MIINTWKVDALKKRHVLLPLVLLGLFATQAWADTPRLYTVELVIFQQLTPSVMQSEQWPSTTSLSAPARFITYTAIDSGATTSMPAPYQAFTLLPAAQMQLNDAVQTLEKSSRYKVLMHIGWRQPGLSMTTTIPVWIEQTQGDTDRSGAAALQGMDKAPSPPSPASAQATASDALPVISPSALPLLEGSIILHRARYLHLSFNLDYIIPGNNTAAPSNTMPPTARPVPATISDSPALGTPGANPVDLVNTASSVPSEIVFGLKEQHRVRKGALTYFDNPAFGVLALVTPYTPPPSPPAATPHPVPGTRVPPVSDQGAIQR